MKQVDLWKMIYQAWLDYLKACAHVHDEVHHVSDALAGRILHHQEQYASETKQEVLELQKLMKQEGMVRVVERREKVRQTSQ